MRFTPDAASAMYVALKYVASQIDKKSHVFVVVQAALAKAEGEMQS